MINLGIFLLMLDASKRPVIEAFSGPVTTKGKHSSSARAPCQLPPGKIGLPGNCFDNLAMFYTKSISLFQIPC
jgi:hypothetical protein